jgi:hypothetical protein
MKDRRHPLHKEHFLEGNRQRWVLIGLLIVLLVLLCNILFRIDPSPYLQAVMLLIGSGVLGWSLDSAVKAYRVDSATVTQSQHIQEEVSARQETIERVYAPKHFDEEGIE